MPSSMSARAGRWIHRSGLAVLYLSLSSCATDTPTAPNASPMPQGPVTPAPTATPPVSPGASTLALSQPDVVFNAATGTILRDSASITVSASSGEPVTELRALTGYGAGQPEGWLTVTIDNHAVPVKVALRAASAPLSPGEYTATVRLTAPGVAPDSLAVTTRVVSGTSIGLNATKICFTTSLYDDDERRDDVTITSVDGTAIGGLTAAITYADPDRAGWLQASFDRTSTPARLWLTGGPRSLPVGTYLASVQVSSAQVGTNPPPIQVTLTINPYDPAKASQLNVHIQWEGPQNGGLATIYGNGGIFCQSRLDGNGPGPNCTGLLESGTGDIRLSRDQDWGGQFLRWTGACTTEGPVAPCTVHFATPGTTQEVTAVYGTMPSTISGILLQGAGASGTVTFSAPVTASGSGEPLTCRLVNGVPEPACNGVVEAGVGTFTVTATPDPGSIFVRWAIGGFPGLRERPISCAEAAPSCTFTFTHGGANFDGVVWFASTSNYALQVEIQGMGNVRWPYSSDRVALDCPTSCVEYFEPGSSVTVTAYPGQGSTFLGWEDCSIPSGTTCTMTMTANRHLVAKFGP